MLRLVRMVFKTILSFSLSYSRIFKQFKLSLITRLRFWSSALTKS